MDKSSKEIMDFGLSRLRTRMEVTGNRFPAHGIFEASAQFLGDYMDYEDEENFIPTIKDATPRRGRRHSWTFENDCGDISYRIDKIPGGFESQCCSPRDKNYVDSFRFNRFMTNGSFYHARTLADDDLVHGTENRKPYSGLDIDLPIIDAIASSDVAIAYGRALNFDAERGEIALSFRWSGLKGRTPNAWIRYNDRWPFESFTTIDVSHFDTSVVIPSNTADEEILSLVFPKLRPFYSDLFRSSVNIDSFAKTFEKYLCGRL